MTDTWHGRPGSMAGHASTLLTMEMQTDMIPGLMLVSDDAEPFHPATSFGRPLPKTPLCVARLGFVYG